ncbi:ABC transporter substrate-binding protein [Gracilibacillus kekensis]|uniref:Carbohydrate ABC transporter substrate-binding protein, CUT1 family n=1 Tax=Gracilibacillus kekensis TaxID=1027249 RepID=A0A1M7PXD7_9BACI|nr:extracellular solute-binding protein [Gracilibacillus kekensis]SHN22404.1 carbohydrate ABC transporter substrate-binding protein, CUT1 family [Gracilibacillus kekensis]
MKRQWGLLWVTALIGMLLLAACSGGDNSSSEGDNEASEDDGSNEESGSEEEITLNFVHWINEENGNWEPIIEMYEEENPGINIESMPLVENMNSQDYFQQLDLMASAGEDLDVIMFSNPNDLAKRIDAGLVEPINSFLDEEGIDINEEYLNGYPAFDGEYYGLPMKQVTMLVMMNKDHLEEAGIEIPTEWTWEDYREIAQQLTTEDHYGSYFHTWHDLFSLIKLLGKPEGANQILKEDGTSNIDDPLVRESLELRNNLENVDESSVPLSENLSQQMDYRQQFFTESISMIPIGSYMLSEWGQFTPDFEIAWAPFPQNEMEDTMYSQVGGDIVSVAKSSEHKQAAYDFIRWLSTEGIMEQGVWVPSWRDADLTAAVENVAANTPNPEVIDIESFVHSISSIEPTEAYAPASYVTEVHTEYAAEVEKYLLGDQDLDTTMENVKERVQSVVDANQ